MKKFGDIVMIGLQPAVVIRAIKRRKWTYYIVVFGDAELFENDWERKLLEYEIYREDKLT